MVATQSLSTPATAADLPALIDRLGGIHPRRIRLQPSPGTATEKDLISAVERKTGPLFELVEATLVEKPMGVEEADFGGELYGFIRDFVRPRKLGKVLPADAMLRLAPGLVRLPDVTFVSAAKWRAWQRLRPAVADFGPDLAVEVLSRSNTRAEMARRRRDFFAAGARIVWEVNPRRRIVTVYTSPTAFTRLTEADTLSGGNVLPGFRLSVADLFADPLAD